MNNRRCFRASRADWERVIRATLAERVAAQETFFGTYRSLAEKLTVSVATAARIVGRLKNAGVVVGGRGQPLRIVIGQARAYIGSDWPAHDVGRVAAWKSVCTRLEDDIRAGTFTTSGRFPSVKELTARYNVCYRTVRRALTDLCSRSLLRREGVRYGLVPAVRPHRAGRIILVARGTEGSGRRHDIAILYERTQRMLSRLDVACGQAEVDLATAPVYYDGRQTVYPSVLRNVLQSPEERAGVLGVVLWPLSLEKSQVLALVERMTSVLRVPMSVFDDEDRTIPHSLAQSTRGLMRFFSLVDQRSAGREVGWYLRRKGCRRVLYVSRDENNEWWSCERWKGVVEGFGRGTRTVEVVSPRGVGLPALGPEVSAVLRRGGYHSLRRLRDVLVRMSYRSALAVAVEPLIAERIRRREVDALVGANDEVAMVCMDIMDTCGVVPGRDIAVVGFDNSCESIACRLTTYDFNETALIDAMVRHILDPRWVRRFRDAGPVVSVPGRLIERESTAVAVPNREVP